VGPGAEALPLQPGRGGAVRNGVMLGAAFRDLAAATQGGADSRTYKTSYLPIASIMLLLPLPLTPLRRYHHGAATLLTTRYSAATLLLPLPHRCRGFISGYYLLAGPASPSPSYSAAHFSYSD
jgi:hypothetical protein